MKLLIGIAVLALLLLAGCRTQSETLSDKENGGITEFSRSCTNISPGTVVNNITYSRDWRCRYRLNKSTEYNSDEISGVVIIGRNRSDLPSVRIWIGNFTEEQREE